MTDTTMPQQTLPAGPAAITPLMRLRRGLSFRNMSAVYILVALIVVFSLWVPDTFLDSRVWYSLIDNGAITALLTIGLVLPLAAGVFNLAIGAELGMGAILLAHLLVDEGLPIPVAFAMTLVVGIAIGTFSGLLITKVKIDSFITTLGMSSVLLALIAWLSGGQQILGLGGSVQHLATGKLLGLTYPVWVMLAVGLVVWFVLDRTTVGRWIHAAGGNADAARLAGVNVSAIVILTLATCGAIAALAGSVVSAQIATGDPTIGPGYMLPAYAAAFLGSTQFRGGRYNVWGAVLAVYVLAVGVKGLQLAGAPVWLPDLFNGVALLVAVAMSRLQRTSARTIAIRHLISRSRGGHATS
jgi:ribose transport system permease protein